MATELNQLIANQQECYEQIKAIHTNFKKDGPARKTLEYLSKRIDSLDTYWAQFTITHKHIQQWEYQESDYFRQDVYSVTYKLYTELRAEMSRLQDEARVGRLTEPDRPEERPGFSAPKPTKSKSTDERYVAIKSAILMHFNERSVRFICLQLQKSGKWKINSAS